MGETTKKLLRYLANEWVWVEECSKLSVKSKMKTLEWVKRYFIQPLKCQAFFIPIKLSMWSILNIGIFLVFKNIKTVKNKIKFSDLFNLDFHSYSELHVMFTLSAAKLDHQECNKSIISFTL